MIMAGRNLFKTRILVSFVYGDINYRVKIVPLTDIVR